MELEQLITTYRRHGLIQAAYYLDVLKDHLHAWALIPHQLGTRKAGEEGSLPGQPERTARAPGPLPAPQPRPELPPQRAPTISVERGHARVQRADSLDKQLHYEIDELGLTARQHNALVQAGFSTIAEVRAALALGVLHWVHDLGMQSVNQIAEAIHRRRLAAGQADQPATRSGEHDPSVPAPRTALLHCRRSTRTSTGNAAGSEAAEGARIPATMQYSRWSQPHPRRCRVKHETDAGEILERLLLDLDAGLPPPKGEEKRTEEP